MRPNRSHEPPMPDALAYFITWTTYGTWLPGDDRGWIKAGKGVQLPCQELHRESEHRLKETPCRLNREQRDLVEQTIARHCTIRGWHLYAVSCRSNHVHVVVSANCKATIVRDQLKAWCTRKLKEMHIHSDLNPLRLRWWTEGGSCRHLHDDKSLEAAIIYATVAQDRKGRDLQ